MQSRSVTRWLLLLVLATSLHAQPPEPSTVRVSVLSLFHPRTLILTADRPVTLLLDGVPVILDAHHASTLSVTPSGLSADAHPARTLTLAASSFTLTVPGKLTRAYTGALTVTLRNRTLLPVVTLQTELAVASIVAAESAPRTPPEALKAQAIAARSFLLANAHAHSFADACDTTHCQFLRSPPAVHSPAAAAALATRHIVLTWRADAASPARIVAAHYSRRCGGITRVPAPTGSYPFFPVRCDFCLRHPLPGGTVRGVGLCQLGAADLAARNQTAQQILSHYFPDTTLAQLP